MIVFVVSMSFSYLVIYQKYKKLEKEQQQVEAQIKKEKEKKKELKKKKEYIKTREFIEKMATEKFGLLYPDEFLLKADE
ncbi:MAG: septum formation initiator family protein [Anaerostipes faecalis]|nr:septum formation initiator family protein [Anaerostipes faecalis]